MVVSWHVCVCLCLWMIRNIKNITRLCRITTELCLWSSQTLGYRSYLYLDYTSLSFDLFGVIDWFNLIFMYQLVVSASRCTHLQCMDVCRSVIFLGVCVLLWIWWWGSNKPGISMVAYYSKCLDREKELSPITRKLYSMFCVGHLIAVLLLLFSNHGLPWSFWKILTQAKGDVNRVLDEGLNFTFICSVLLCINRFSHIWLFMNMLQTLFDWLWHPWTMDCFNTSNTKAFFFYSVR